ncbi:MAG: methyltransferase [Steroidobacteraceae bacterium]|nr:methyltransferase [Steroidobacteraceae bacterium]
MPQVNLARVEVRDVESDIAATLPDYLVDTYSWAYLRPRSLRLLDRHLVVNGILWGNYNRLVRDACDEFAPGDHVLQAASVYGNLSSRLADRLGDEGFLDVIDVAPLQVAHCRRKLAGRENVEVRPEKTPGRQCTARGGPARWQGHVRRLSPSASLASAATGNGRSVPLARTLCRWTGFALHHGFRGAPAGLPMA